MSTVTLVTGGCRSGKSRFALTQAMTYETRAFIATAVAFDDEMNARIGRHQAERGSDFETFEAPYGLGEAIRSLPPGSDVAVVDCLTVWLSNLMYKHGETTESYPEMETFFAAIENPPCDLYVVTNEVGTGIVPENALARRFRDEAGFLNQAVAQRADRVVWMVAGCPVAVKGMLEQ